MPPFLKPRAILQRGTRANQPSADTVAEGSLYCVTDEGVVERSNGSAWQHFAVALIGDELPVEFQSYTPAWTSSGTAPAIGNGTLVGEYVEIGDFVAGSLTLTFGSTTSGGTGVWFFGLPVAAGAGTNLAQPAVVSDPGVASYACHIRLTSTTTFAIFVNSTGTIVSASNPMTFGTSDQVVVQFWYKKG